MRYTISSYVGSHIGCVRSSHEAKCPNCRKEFIAVDDTDYDY